jgi:hypothetical protein
VLQQQRIYQKTHNNSHEIHVTFSICLCHSCPMSAVCWQYVHPDTKPICSLKVKHTTLT